MPGDICDEFRGEGVLSDLAIMQPVYSDNAFDSSHRISENSRDGVSCGNSVQASVSQSVIDSIMHIQSGFHSC